jgi:cell division protein ZapE
MKLTERHPHLDAQALVGRFVPPPRFADARFDNYQPDPEYPSQAGALAALQTFTTPKSTQKRKFLHRRQTSAYRPGVYLDGGFGVGKTHLLAALWNTNHAPSAYTTFTELTAFIGFSGLKQAVAALQVFDLICIDEFELDDVANTLMVVSLLRSLAEKTSLRLAVTSNTLPDRLGEKRFSAQDFKREIAAIASYFDEIRMDGKDFRSSHQPDPVHSAGEGITTEDDFHSLLTHLRQVHPVQYGAMLDGISAVAINGVQPIDSQDDALLFVQFVDKLYEARIQVKLSGVAIERIFAGDYRHGGYRLKYGRAESRMQAMNRELAG